MGEAERNIYNGLSISPLIHNKRYDTGIIIIIMNSLYVGIIYISIFRNGVFH